VLHQGHAGSGNILSTPYSLLRKNLCAATRGCPEPDAMCGCFAGLLTDQERMLAENLMREIAPRAKLQAQPDYCAAFMASPEETHMCVIAGTGSVLCSRDPEGKWVKSGARGYLLGNPGSAFRYGQDALLEYLDHPSDASEAMIKAVQEAFESLEEAQIVAKLYRAPAPAAVLARMGPVVAKDAKLGKAYAKRSLENQTILLAEQAAGHLRTHFPAIMDPVVSLAGGVWEASGVYKDGFIEALKKELPDRDVKFVKLVKPPVHGAARLAKELLA
jgi:N-acetylglucosamine kinase-like BadF-type ATPase